MNRSPLFFPSLAFILGVGAGSFALFPWWGVLTLLAASVGMLGTVQTKRVVIAVAAVFCFSGGFFLAEREIGRAQGIVEISGGVSGTADVVGIPKRKDFFQEVIFRFTACEKGDCPEQSVLVQAPLSEAYTYGDRAHLSCKRLSLPKNFSEDFDYRMYLAKDGISYMCEKATMRKVGSRIFFTKLFGFTERFEDGIMEHIPDPEASLGAGILLGGDGRFPEEAKEWFRGAGLSHIVAVSGYNIAILSFAFLFLGIFFFLPRRQAILFALAASGVFVFLAGMPSSGVRALAMAGVIFLATLLGRRSASVPALVFAGALMLLLNPLLLRYDVGFQLSFLATLGIVLFSPYARELVAHVRYGQLFVETALLTLSAELLILPILFATFKTFSLAAILSNTLLLPLVPYAMLCSFLAGLVGMIAPVLGEAFAFPAYVLLHVIVGGAKWFSEIAIGRITLAHFGWMEGILWYAVVFAALFFSKRWMKRKNGGV
jgi:competence protein ComEC